MAQTTATATSHYAYRAAIYHLAVDDGDPHRNRRRLTALSSSFAPPIGYEVAGEAMAVSAVDIGSLAPSEWLIDGHSCADGEAASSDLP
jgi:hypothetical protein